MNPTQLKNLMMYLGLTRLTLADKLGVTEGAVRHWLDGRRDVPKCHVKVLRIWGTQPGIMKLWETA